MEIDSDTDSQRVDLKCWFWIVLTNDSIRDRRVDLGAERLTDLCVGFGGARRGFSEILHVGTVLCSAKGPAS